MRTALGFLAGHRWAGVGLAFLSELLLLVGLSLATPSATLGMPAAVAAAIAGTVAVVFGVGDGVAVATAGAVAFAALGGWGAGELAAIGVWPSIVAAVGLFARRIERDRVALRDFVDAQEAERRALALTLHDDSAQMLTGALLTLRSAAPGSDAAPQVVQARKVINDTIQQLRRLALQLSPKALEDYGLAAALSHLTETEASLGEMPVAFASEWEGRLSRETEWALFRFAQAALAAARSRGASAVTVGLFAGTDNIRLSVLSAEVDAASASTIPAAVAERIRLLGGRVSAIQIGSGEISLCADVPAQLAMAAA